MKLHHPAFLAVLLSCLASQPARAEAVYALTCIGTDTGYTIHYEYRWGEDDEWKAASVEPGNWKLHTWNYDYPGANTSPQLTIRYDDDLTGGSNHVTTDLGSYAAEYKDCEDEGKIYEFWEQGDELFVQEVD